MKEITSLFSELGKGYMVLVILLTLMLVVANVGVNTFYL